VTPLAVAYDAAQDVLTVEGVRYSGAFFRTLAWPARSRLYRFERRDGTVQVSEATAADLWEALRTLGAPGRPDGVKEA